MNNIFGLTMIVLLVLGLLFIKIKSSEVDLIEKLYMSYCSMTPDEQYYLTSTMNLAVLGYPNRSPEQWKEEADRRAQEQNTFFDKLFQNWTIEQKKELIPLLNTTNTTTKSPCDIPEETMKTLIKETQLYLENRIEDK